MHRQAIAKAGIPQFTRGLKSASVARRAINVDTAGKHSSDAGIESVKGMRNPRIFTRIPDLRSWRKQQLIMGKSVGLVPTMGALHEGHLDLLGESLAHNDSTIVSIFVNPSQFSPSEDLQTYPRNLDHDVNLLTKFAQSQKAAGGQLAGIFTPTVESMYPSGIPLNQGDQRGAFVTVEGLSHQLEGAVRPHFFRGVATVVTKLFNVVTPDRAYFGQKDVQQTVVVSRLIQDLLLPIEMNVVKTSREPSGLAQSSRNVYLPKEIRETEAAVIYRALAAGKRAFQTADSQRSGMFISRQVILSPIRDILEPVLSSSGWQLDYLELSDCHTLESLDSVPVSNIENGVNRAEAIVSIAIRIPNASGSFTRLIDNVLLDQDE